MKDQEGCGGSQQGQASGEWPGWSGKGQGRGQEGRQGARRGKEGTGGAASGEEGWRVARRGGKEPRGEVGANRGAKELNERISVSITEVLFPC